MQHLCVLSFPWCKYRIYLDHPHQRCDIIWVGWEISACHHSNSLNTVPPIWNMDLSNYCTPWKLKLIIKCFHSENETDQDFVTRAFDSSYCNVTWESGSAGLYWCGFSHAAPLYTFVFLLIWLSSEIFTQSFLLRRIRHFFRYLCWVCNENSSTFFTVVLSSLLCTLYFTTHCNTRILYFVFIFYTLCCIAHGISNMRSWSTANITAAFNWNTFNVHSRHLISKF